MKARIEFNIKHNASEEGSVYKAIYKCVNSIVASLCMYGVYFTSDELFHTIGFERKGDDIIAYLKANINEKNYYKKVARLGNNRNTARLRVEQEFQRNIMGSKLVEKFFDILAQEDRVTLESKKVFNMHRPSIWFMHRAEKYFNYDRFGNFVFGVVVLVVNVITFIIYISSVFVVIPFAVISVLFAEALSEQLFICFKEKGYNQ